MAAISERIEEGGLTRFHLRIEFVVAAHLLLGSVCVGLLTMIFTQLVPEWGLTPWHVGAISIANSLGAAIGALAGGTTSDRMGRKYTARIALLVVGFGTVLSALSWGWESLAVFQFIAGVGMAGIAPCVSVLIGEFAPARYRGRLSATVEFFWASGWLIAVAAAFIIIPLWGWRAAFLFGGVSLLYAAIQSKLVY